MCICMQCFNPVSEFFLTFPSAVPTIVHEDFILGVNLKIHLQLSLEDLKSCFRDFTFWQPCWCEDFDRCHFLSYNQTYAFLISYLERLYHIPLIFLGRRQVFSMLHYPRLCKKLPPSPPDLQLSRPGRIHIRCHHTDLVMS